MGVSGSLPDLPDSTQSSSALSESIVHTGIHGKPHLLTVGSARSCAPVPVAVLLGKPPASAGLLSGRARSPLAWPRPGHDALRHGGSLSSPSNLPVNLSVLGFFSSG